ncbi:FAS1-like dehydratase domain-containing protein [Rhodococcus sp. ACT016]|uniref:FAS1-like dehydratase domain-containing protein n=1 Tax=Rhodococcus sp. ACT016 TaxID=3134808 RepID=UPI003D2C0F5E
MTGEQRPAPTGVTEELLDPAPVLALSSLFDDGNAEVRHGDLLPPLWHWAALARWTASSRIGSDGHPVRGDDDPAAGLPRRMFAGGEVQLLAPLRVGTTIRRASEILSVNEKTGRSGPFVVVTTETRLFADAETPALIERQDIVYRPAAEVRPGEARVAHAAPPAGSPLRRENDGWAFATDPTLLMRFSAATANAHRIHYDWPYATGVEGYPALVVHGPLMTLALAEAVRLDFAERAVRVRHRNVAPLFCGQPAYISCTRTGSESVALAMQSGPRDQPTTHTTLTVDFIEH